MLRQALMARRALLLIDGFGFIFFLLTVSIFGCGSLVLLRLIWLLLTFITFVGFVQWLGRHVRCGGLFLVLVLAKFDTLEVLLH